MVRHPSKSELLAYAESLSRGQGAFSAHVGAHIAQCAICRKEVCRMCATFSFTRVIPQLTPSPDLQARTLAAAYQERSTRQQSRSRLNILTGAAKAAAYAAVLVLTAALLFNVASSTEVTDTNLATNGLRLKTGGVTAASAETLRKADEIRTLSEALRPNTARPGNPRELEHRRAVQQLDAQLYQAILALSRNPGSPRVNHVVCSNLERTVEKLRDLYIERSL
jgi:hypothetical protein